MIPPRTAREVGEVLAKCVGYPERYADVMLPWRLPDTHVSGRALKTWQREFLSELGKELRARRFDGIHAVRPVQMSTASGHGIGKSFLVALLVHYFVDCYPGCSLTVTATTQAQLQNRTWRELGKIHNIILTRAFTDFTNSQGSMRLAHVDPAHGGLAIATTAAIGRADSMQGQHAAHSLNGFIIDEASGVPPEVWETTMGGLTDGLPVYLAFGNPIHNTGFFYDTHHRLRNSWIRRKIDSRAVEGASHELFEEWVDTWGEDSDFVKARVRGEFPDQGALQFIPVSAVDWCMKEVVYDEQIQDALVYGVDVARFGDDQSVVCRRRGRRVYPLRYRFRGLATTELASKIAALAAHEHPDAIYVDGDGVGGGVVDILRSLNVPNVIEVHGAGKGDAISHNMRAKSWSAMKAALVGREIDLPDDADLAQDLCSVEYGYNLTTNRIVLESKESMRKRGVASPDLADALALTFSLPMHGRGKGYPESHFGEGWDLRAGVPEPRRRNVVTDAKSIWGD